MDLEQISRSTELGGHVSTLYFNDVEIDSRRG